ncbi:hypothetical protein [Rubinisphaera italica]|uniref:hypothetical protein n=1 Tax=Rubinisphaera italica TaxID=2527969 RepID=UPI0011B525A1|nr:hypothetical protein [Rubinisphaera italica]
MINAIANTGKAEKNIKNLRGTVGTLGSGIGSLKTAFVGLVGVMGLGLGFSALKSGVKSAMTDLDRLAKTADTLNLKVGELSALQLGAGLSGSDASTLEKGLQRLVRRIGEAKQGLGAGKKALEQFGLSADDLGKMSTIDVLKTISQKIKELPDATERAAAAYALFGRQGQELQLFLGQGAEGIDQLLQKSDELGGNFDRIELAQVESANDRIAEMGFLFDNLKKKMAIQLIPVIEMAATAMTNFTQSMSSNGAEVPNAMNPAIGSLAYLADMLELVSMGWELMQYAANRAISLILVPVKYLGLGLQKVMNLIHGEGSTSGGDDLAVFTDGMWDQASEDWNALGDSFIGQSGSSKITQAFEDMAAKSRESAEATVNSMQDVSTGVEGAVNEANNSVYELIDSLEQQIATFGMSSDQAKLYQLAQDGATQAVLAEAEALQQQLTVLNEQTEAMKEAEAEHEKMQSKAEQIIESTKTDIEKVQDQIGELDSLLASGLIDQSTYEKAAQNALDTLDEKSSSSNAGTFSSLDSVSKSIQQAALNTKDKAAQQLDQLKMIATNGVKQLDEMKKSKQLLLA